MIRLNTATDRAPTIIPSWRSDTTAAANTAPESTASGTNRSRSIPTSSHTKYVASGIHS